VGEKENKVKVNKLEGEKDHFEDQDVVGCVILK